MEPAENIYNIAIASTFDQSMLKMALSAPVSRECYEGNCSFGEDPYLDRVMREAAECCLKTDVRPLDSDTVNGILGHVVTSSMVLLKNNKRLLPFTSTLLRSLAVIGPVAGAHIVDGVKNAAPQHINIMSALGCPAEGGFSDELLAAALSTAVRSDAIILCLGETGQNRTRIPAPQLALLEALSMLGKPIAAAVFGETPYILDELEEKTDALLLAWRMTKHHSLALGHVLFGQVNPSGRLPITLHRSDSDPGETDGSYLYMRQEPLYPFGYGLSYTRFIYGGLRLSACKIPAGRRVTGECVVENSGTLPGHEVAQFYIRQESRGDIGLPRWSLFGNRRVFLRPGESRAVSFELPVLTEPARYVVYAGGHQPDARSVWLSETPVLSSFMEVE